MARMGKNLSPRDIARLRRLVQQVQPKFASPADAPAGIDKLTQQSANVASATTLDLKDIGGDYTHITGSGATITGIAELEAGVVRTLVFDGANTLVYNATSFILPGSANITTAAGDIAVATSEGSGNWRLAYFPADGLLPVSDAVLAQAVVNAIQASSAMSNQLAGDLSDYGMLNVGARMSVSSSSPVADATTPTVVYIHPFSSNGIAIYNSSGTQPDGWYQRPTSIPASGSFGSVALTNSMTASFSNASKTLTVTNQSDLIVGMTVTGTNIAASTTITALNSDGVTITVNNNTTGAGPQTVTFKVPSGKAVDVFALWDQTNSKIVYRMGPLWSTTTTRGYTLSTRGDGTPFVGNTRPNIGIRTTDFDQAIVSDATLIGSIYCNADGSTTDNPLHRFVSNMWNRRPRPMVVTDATDTWTQTTVATWRQARASTANQVDFFLTWTSDDYGLDFDCYGLGVGSVALSYAVGIGIDSITANSAQILGGKANAAAVLPVWARLRDLSGSLAPGYHYAAWLEITENTTLTWHGDGGLAYRQAGLTGSIWN